MKKLLGLGNVVTCEVAGLERGDGFFILFIFWVTANKFQVFGWEFCDIGIRVAPSPGQPISLRI